MIKTNPNTSIVIENTFIDLSKPSIESKLLQLSLVTVGKRKLPEGKIFVLGDEISGKSKLIQDLNKHNNKNQEKKDPKRRKSRCCCHCCCFRRRKPKELQPFVLNFMDALTHGEGKLRALNYLDTDIIVLCFHAADENSFKNLKETWIPEVKMYCPAEVPLIIVCLRNDVRILSSVKRKENSIKRKTMQLYGLIKQPGIPKIHGEQLAKSINAFGYVECSSRSEEGLEDLKICLINALTNNGADVTENKVISHS